MRWGAGEQKKEEEQEEQKGRVRVAFDIDRTILIPAGISGMRDRRAESQSG